MDGGDMPLHGEELLAIGSVAREQIAGIQARALSHQYSPAAARGMLVAECAYYLRDVPRVIEHIQAAINAGCQRPILYFSMGYNQFDQAIQPAIEAGGRLSALGREEFDQAILRCTDSVWSFARALRDEPFDAQIYYWIGVVAETLGANRQALKAYELAALSDPGFAPVLAEKHAALTEGEEAGPAAADPGDPVVAFQSTVDEILKIGRS